MEEFIKTFGLKNFDLATAAAGGEGVLGKANFTEVLGDLTETLEALLLVVMVLIIVTDIVFYYCNIL